jgi:hypothetical protein
MGVSRYSRDPRERKRQEHFDHLQWRTGIDVYAPTIGELRGAGVEWINAECRNTQCHHRAPFELDRFPIELTTARLRARLVCTECGTPRPRLILEWTSPCTQLWVDHG